jgi:hypothetical protein
VERYTAAAKEVLEQAAWLGGTQFLRELADELGRRER